MMPYQQEIIGLIPGLRPANERRHYFVTTSLIRWTQALNQPWITIVPLKGHIWKLQNLGMFFSVAISADLVADF